MLKVLIIQAEMKRYRLPFFSGLHASLLSDGIEVSVAYSNSNPIDVIQGDSTDLPPPIGRKVSGRWFFGRFVYQALWREVFAADLVIVGPEIKYLINPILLIMSWCRLKTIAFWGLGPNKRPNRSPLAEWVKQHFYTKVDWWFAYTETVAEYLKLKGMPPDKITNVQNATDSIDLRRLLAEINSYDVTVARRSLMGSGESYLGLYCGVLSEIKDLPLLLESARLVRRQCPGFHLAIIGNGPRRSWLEDAVSDEPWIHYLGSKYGRESALYYKAADAFLLAGTAGLAIVDCFAAGLPLLATDLPTHPPEISYVRHGHNGLIVAHNAVTFASAIVEVLSNCILRERLRKGAVESGARYTMEAMIENYGSGIKRCLGKFSISPGAASISRQLNQAS
jgi:L-malate glycosyltransferase